jgi:4-amino-4-deoxy-L-arabinose transferase-like glycosyltransferase
VKKNLLLLFLLALFLFTFKIGSTPILDGDTAFWARIAKNILNSGDWLTLRFVDPSNIIDKPPLFPWMIALGFKLFGINEFALSIFHSILAALTVLLTYLIARELFDEKTAFWSALILLTSAQFFYQGRSPLQDMPLTVFIAASLWAYIKWEKSKNFWFFYISGAFSALAVMSKGPVGFALPAVVILSYVLFSRKWKLVFNWHLVGAILAFLLFTVPWFLAEYRILGPRFLQAMWSGHFGRFLMPVDLIGKPSAENVIRPQFNFYAYFLQLLLLAVPWSGFIYPAWFKYLRDKKMLFILCWSLGVILFFSLSLNYKISRYILPAFPALAILIAKFWMDFMDDPEKFKRPMKVSIWLTSVLIIPLLFLGTLYLIYAFPAEQAGYRPILLPFLALLSVGMAISVILWFLNKPLSSLKSFTLSALLAYLVLMPLVSIYFKEANPIKEYCQKIENLYRPGDLIVKYKGFDDHFMMFYLDQKVLTVNEEREMKRMLSSRTRVLSVTEEPNSLENLKIKVLSRKNNFVLFSNR